MVGFDSARGVELGSVGVVILRWSGLTSARQESAVEFISPFTYTLQFFCASQ